MLLEAAVKCGQLVEIGKREDPLVALVRFDVEGQADSTLDADRDGQVSKQEFLSYHARMFDMMDTDKKRMLGKQQFIIPGH